MSNIFCDNSGNGFQSSAVQSSAIQSGGSDPSVIRWGARRLNLSIADVQQTIQEGRMVGTGIWNIDGNTQIHLNN
jgi:hypothetical protein